jgi:hypothetical protein
LIFRIKKIYQHKAHVYILLEGPAGIIKKAFEVIIQWLEDHLLVSELKFA